MIIDSLEHLNKYASVNPRFSKAIEFLTQNDLQTLPLGRVLLDGEDLVVNVVQTEAKARAKATLETHQVMIDIQIPLSGEETMGYTPKINLPTTEYDQDNDISFYPGEADTYFTLQPGMFAIFFPQDGHAPAITPQGVKKIIVKVRAL